MPPALLWWILAACVFVILPAALAFVGDEPPDNTLTQEQQGEPRQDPDKMRAVAA